MFDLSASAVKQSALLGNTVGLLLETVKSPSPRFGANLLITADTKSNTLVSLQYAVSWSLLHALEVESVIFKASDPLEIDLSGPDFDSGEPRLFRPHVEQHWSFPRAEVFASNPKELVEFGWPSESAEFPRWHFGGALVADWMKIVDMPTFVAKTIVEMFSDKSRPSVPIELRYDDNLLPLPSPTPKPSDKQP